MKKRGLVALALVALLAAVQGSSATSRTYTTKRMVVLTGDVTDSSGANTYADCTGLSFTVANGVRYWFEAHVWYTAAATTTGSGWAINGPTTTDISYTGGWTIGQTDRHEQNASAYDLPTTSSAASLTAGNVAVIEGTILPSADGTVVVRFMTEVDTSAIVCKAGSYIEFWRVP